MYIVNNKPVIKDSHVIIPADWSSRESKAMETVKSSVLVRSPGRGRRKDCVEHADADGIEIPNRIMDMRH